MKKKKRDKERNQFWISCMRGYSSGWRYIIQTLKRYAFHSFSRFSKKKQKRVKRKEKKKKKTMKGKYHWNRRPDSFVARWGSWWTKRAFRCKIECLCCTVGAQLCRRRQIAGRSQLCTVTERSVLIDGCHSLQEAISATDRCVAIEHARPQLLKWPYIWIFIEMVT